MKPTRQYLAIGLTAVGVLGVLWAVYAQEIALPPPVLQADAPLPEPRPPEPKPPEKKAPARNPLRPEALRDKSKPDPTLIIPPEVFDVPHDLPVPMLPAIPAPSKSGLQLTDGGSLPPPTFPPVVQAKEPMDVPPLIPPVDPRGSALPAIPALRPEPTKMLIDPLALDPDGPPNPVRPPNPKKDPVAANPPTVVFPNPADNLPPPPPKVKAFVRLNSTANDVKPAPLNAPVAPPVGMGIAPSVGVNVNGGVGVGLAIAPPTAANYAPNPGALVNLQMPALAVEKRGPANLRSGETQSYQIAIRNLGSVPAQQIRIDDEIPAGARLVFADPQPQLYGPKAVWTLSALPAGAEQIVRISLQAEIALQIGSAGTSVHVSAMQPASTTAMRPPATAPAPLTVQCSGPERAAVGASMTFDVKITNVSPLPLTGVKLFGYLPEGLDTKHGHSIEMENPITIPPGDFRTLKMPANAVAAGRQTVRVKVAFSGGEEWASANVNVTATAASLGVRQPEMTRLFLGREGELRIDLTNDTGKPIRHVQVNMLIPEGIDYLGSNNRGGYQSNHRTAYWLIDTMPAGQMQSLSVRVNGARPGQYQSLVFAKADGIAEVRSSGTIVLEGRTSLNLNVTSRDNVLELGRETTYEIRVGNGGGIPARNVRVQVQFPQGLIPGNAQGNTRSTVQGQTITFDPLPSLARDGQAIYRVSARAQAAGDLRVRFLVASDEVQTPLVKEINVKTY